MTIDERLEFLLQSTESLHSTVQELTADISQLRASVAGLTNGFDDLSARLADLTRVAEIDAENIRALANITTAHQ